jgi:hypothetical protein
LKTVEEVLDKLKEMKGIEPGHGSDVELSLALKVRKQVVTNWRYRKQIVWKSLMRALSPKEFQIVYDWAHEGEGEPSALMLVQEQPTPSTSILPGAGYWQESIRLVEDALQGRFLPIKEKVELITLVAEDLAEPPPDEEDTRSYIRGVVRALVKDRLARQTPK